MLGFACKLLLCESHGVDVVELGRPNGWDTGGEQGRKPGAVADFSAYGVDLRVRLGQAGEQGGRVSLQLSLCVGAWLLAEAGLLFRDEKRLFTTATVLAALGRFEAA